MKSNRKFPKINKKTIVTKTLESRRKIEKKRNQTKLKKLEKDLKKNYKIGVLPNFYQNIKENLNKKKDYDKMLEKIQKQNLLKE